MQSTNLNAPLSGKRRDRTEVPEAPATTACRTPRAPGGARGIWPSRGCSVLQFARQALLLLAGLTFGGSLLLPTVLQAAEQDWLRQLRLAKEQESRGDYRAAYKTLTGVIRTAGQNALGPLALAVTTNNAGAIAQELGDYRVAEHFYKQSATYWKAAGGAEEDATTPLNNLATLYARTGRGGRAIEIYQQVLDIRRRMLGPLHPAVARATQNYGMALHREGHLDQAERLYCKALQILSEIGSPTSETGVVESNLANLLLDRGSYPEAAKMAEQAVRSLSVQAGPHHSALVPALTWQAAALLKSGSYQEAESLLRQAEALARDRIGAWHPDLAVLLKVKVDLLVKCNRKREARLVRREVQSIWKDLSSLNLLGHTVDLESLSGSRR